MKRRSSSTRRHSATTADLLRQTYPKRLLPMLGHPWRISLGLLIVHSGLMGLMALAYGGFSGTPNTLDYVEDYGGVLANIAFATCIFYYLAIPHLFDQSIAQLQGNHAFRDHPLKISDHVQRRLAAHWVRALPFVFAALATLAVWFWLFAFIRESATAKNWYYDRIVPTTYILCIIFAAYVAVGGMLLNIVLSIYALNDLMANNQIQVFALHPDRGGGFSSIGSYSLRLSLIALPIGVFLVIFVINDIRMGVLGQDYIMWFLVAIYVLLVPGLFYLSIRGVHRQMVKFKNDLIQEIAAVFLSEQLVASQHLTSDQPSLDHFVKRMDALKALEKHLREYPVWPFNFRIQLGIIVNSLFPLIATLIGLAIDLLGIFR